MWWILSGGFSTSSRCKASTSISTVATSEAPDHRLEALLRSFWETEEKIQNTTSPEEEGEKCEEFYKATTTRGEDGRYICRLPFRLNVVLGRSKHIAMAMMKRLEVQFKRSPSLKERYVQCMQEYFDRDTPSQ